MSDSPSGNDRPKRKPAANPASSSSESGAPDPVDAYLALAARWGLFENTRLSDRDDLDPPPIPEGEGLLADDPGLPEEFEEEDPFPN